MKILVCGGRNYDNGFHVWEILDKLHEELGFQPLIIIEGGAHGVDTHAREWAEMNYIPHWEFPANWTKHGKSAGPIRNRYMLIVGQPDLVVAFPGGVGTAHMVQVAEEAGVTVRKIEANS